MTEMYIYYVLSSEIPDLNKHLSSILELRDLLNHSYYSSAPYIYANCMSALLYFTQTLFK